MRFAEFRFQTRVKLMVLTGDFTKDLKTIKNCANVVYPDNEILRDICVCQAILESGVLHGGSLLSNKYNNLFGIKGKGIVTQKSIKLPTHEEMDGKMITVSADFAWNDSVEESFMQHRKILSFPRYANLWKCTTFDEAAQDIQKDGYATDSKYPGKLIGIYNKYVRDD